ncbi:hypothetical protein K504DRAFT_504388 [Pleomassaria siparia CBS 279.74]|uniref:Uncharacterized protein n=1 Tax=Pleomassaria siparia CBS 279.74 TaxID=1314801 RepID=A0A6G1K4A1_9PLEO|nr:hypothetical protein K504DRAFT_504388 [Pleomassaria siparia CBS 279.74]
MGQGQSQSDQGRTLSGEVVQSRPETSESERVDPTERARQQAEERSRRAAAAEQRLTSKRKAGAVPMATSRTTGKKPSALEELSKENRGWRDADANATLRAYN